MKITLGQLRRVIREHLETHRLQLAEQSGLDANCQDTKVRDPVAQGKLLSDLARGQGAQFSAPDPSIGMMEDEEPDEGEEETLEEIFRFLVATVQDE